MSIIGFLRWDLKYTFEAYEKYYRDELRAAFAQEKQKRKQLVYAYGLYHEKRYAEALDPLKSLMRRSGAADDRRAVLLAMALCLDELGQRKDAEQVYLTLLHLCPEHTTALSNLGLLLMNQGRFREAQAYLRRSVSLDGSNAVAWMNLGFLHLRMGQYALAIGPLKEAFERNPKLYNAAAALAKCYAALDDRAAADAWSKTAIEHGQSPDGMEGIMNHLRSIQPDLDSASEETRALYHSWKSRSGAPSIVVGLGGDVNCRSYVGGWALGEVPLAPDGRPMRQLAAIFCEEFPDVGLPEHGLIRIFIADDDKYGMDLNQPNVQKGFRILYDRNPAGLTMHEEPLSETFPVRGCLPMKLHTRVTQPMPACDFRFARTYPGDATDELCELIHDAYHRMGGYPCSYQWDPREQEAYARYDHLLFQLDTMDGGKWGIRIGDGGCMKFCIPSEKLAAGDFSDVLYWWD